MKLLDKQAILDADDMEFQVVDVPEWGGSVRLKGMTGAERDQWEQSMLARGNTKEVTDIRGMKINLLGLVIVDESGFPLFSPKEVALLGNKSAKALERLWDVASEMNGLGEDKLKEMEKNSEAVQSESSGSD